MTDKEMVVHRLTETSNFIDYLKTSPLFSKSLIDVMVTAIDNGVALLTDQPEIIRCKDCFYGEVEPDDNSYFFCTHPLHKLESHESSYFCADGERR